MPEDWWRLSAREWQELLDDDQMRATYYGKIYRTSSCAWWLGALSESGHGRLRAPRHLGSHVVPAHLFGYQLSRGPVQRGPDGKLPIIRHRCDNASCQSGAHLLARTAARNAQDYRERSCDPCSPLADRRGPAGRARAIRDAILACLARELPADAIEREIQRAANAGLPGQQDSLF